MTTIQLPHNWRPRHYQLPLWKYLENGGKRAFALWHRRAGKDDLCLNFTACESMQRIGNYWHMLPEAAQARKAIWDAVNPHTGKKRIDEAFPKEIRKRTNNQEMFIELVNGSTWQVLGSDNFNSQVGSTPRGIVFSEWALADPNAWAYMRPILAENGGWALFITTPRGRNHAKRMFDAAMAAMKEDGSWFCERLTADQTGVFTPETLKTEERELIAEMGEDEGKAKMEQEYYCSFDAALPGAYYGKEMNKAESDGRIGKAPYNPSYPVFPVFDFGKGLSNSTAIWFVQIIGAEVRVIDYEEGNSGDIAHYGKLIKDKGYLIGKLILPHDGKVEHLSTGLSYEQQYRAMGFDVAVLPQPSSVLAHITLTRALIAQSYFDEKNCERGIDCLRNYHREYDEANKVFKPNPKHNWSSHGSDAFRYVAQAKELGLLVVHEDTGPINVNIGSIC